MTMRRNHNELIRALKAAIQATFSDGDWKELGYATNTIEWINSHPRLLRSLHWGDEDYSGHVFEAIEYILDEDRSNLEALLENETIERWIEKNRPNIFAEYYGGIQPARKAVSDAERAAEGFDIDDHIRRIFEGLKDDSALAIGSTKELLETVFKEVLGLHGAAIGSEDMPKLWKRVQAALDIDPKDVAVETDGGEPLRRLLGSMNQIVVAVTELRNLYGTGHGKSRAPRLTPEAAQLTVSAGTAVAVYVMRRYKRLKKTDNSR